MYHSFHICWRRTPLSDLYYLHGRLFYVLFRTYRTVLDAGKQGPPLACDVASDASIADCLKAFSARHDHLDLLVNNAGISTPDHPDDPATGIRREDLLRVLDVNVAGVCAVTQAFLPLLRKNGRVMNVSSLLGSVELSRGATSATSYRCSKASLNMLTTMFANEVADVTFVSMHPGWVQTDMGGSKGRKAPVTVEQSVVGMLDTLEKRTLADSGSFWGFDGTALPY